MPNYATARTNMVDSQIHTAGVVSAPVLEAFRTVPREDFVPDRLKGLVYADEDLQLGQGRFLMEPAVLARMIEAVNVNSADTVFNIGDFTGYSSAILAQLAASVVVPDQAQENESYSLIILNGAVAEIPQKLLDMLALHGRIIGIVKKAGSPMGTVTVMERVGEDQYSTCKLFDAATPYIPGFEPRATFSF